VLLTAPPVELLVVGAHLRDQPLNHQLVAAGGSLIGEVRTSADYRLYALATTPPKPGLARVAEDGSAIAGELWSVPAAGFGLFVAALPEPMGIVAVRLEDGRRVAGFLCERVALDGAQDITAFGGWRAYRSAGA
jgi:allophanate hydrolase